LRELGGDAPQQWAAQARALDKLYAPTRYPDALGDAAPMDVFGPEDAERAMQAAKAFLDWAATELNPVA
jgi:HEPN domain-containing protein